MSCARARRIDVLANNAGALFGSRRLTSEGFEQTFALNHLAPFLLTHLLRDRLGGARVITTASDAHKAGRLDLSDLNSASSFAAPASTARRSSATSSSPASSPARARAARELLSPGVVRTGSDKNESGFGATRISDDVDGPVPALARARRALARLARDREREAAALSGVYVEDESASSSRARRPRTRRWPRGCGKKASRCSG